MFAEKHSSLSSYVQGDSILWTIRGGNVLGYPLAYPGEGLSGPAPLILRENRGPKGGKKILETAPSPPCLRFWMTRLAPYLKVWIRHCRTAFKLGK